MDFSDFQTNVPLAPYTTTGIGGNAEYLDIATKQSEFFTLLKFLHTHPELPYTILGLGSNVIISDSGLPGLTIINKASQIKIIGNWKLEIGNFIPTYTQRKENEPDQYLDFSKIDYDESGLPTQEVLLQAGVPLPVAINHTLNNGLTGLQWFSYIPGTIGGAVFQNIHGGKYHFSDYIVSVKVFDLKTGKTKIYKKSELDWHYETSYFQQNPNLIILSARLRLFKGDPSLAKKVSAAWISQKSKVQPMNSPGSAFANPSLEICLPIWGEQKSAGWIIDHELDLKGFKIGDAQISLQHSNFFINTGHATASDYKKLVDYIHDKVKTKFGFDLIPEVKFLGKF